MKLALTIPGYKDPIGIPGGVPSGGLDTFTNIVSVLLNLALVLGIGWCFFQILRGGLNIITSGGNKEKFQGGRERIRWAIIGLIVVFLSFGLINLISLFVGVNLFVFNPF
jgi:hypothetical protein